MERKQINLNSCKDVRKVENLNIPANSKIEMLKIFTKLWAIYTYDS